MKKGTLIKSGIYSEWVFVFGYDNGWNIQLTADGSQFVADWHAEHGSGIALLRKAHKSTYWRARQCHLDDDTIESACRLAMVSAVRTYDPTKSKFSTHLARWLLNEVQKEIERTDMYKWIPAFSGRGGDYSGWDEVYAAGLDEVAGCETAEAAEAIRRENVEHATRLAAELLVVLPKTEASVIHSRQWLGMTLREIADELGVTRERVRQIEASGMERMRRSAIHKQIQGVEA